MEANAPVASRSAMAASMAASPTFLIAASPYRIAPWYSVPSALGGRVPSSGSGANLSELLFTSGSRILIPIRSHSATNTLILSVLEISLLITAAMNSTG